MVPTAYLLLGHLSAQDRVASGSFVSTQEKKKQQISSPPTSFNLTWHSGTFHPSGSDSYSSHLSARSL